MGKVTGWHNEVEKRLGSIPPPATQKDGAPSSQAHPIPCVDIHHVGLRRINDRGSGKILVLGHFGWIIAGQFVVTMIIMMTMMTMIDQV